MGYFLEVGPGGLSPSIVLWVRFFSSFHGRVLFYFYFSCHALRLLLSLLVSHGGLEPDCYDEVDGERNARDIAPVPYLAKHNRGFTTPVMARTAAAMFVRSVVALCSSMGVPRPSSLEQSRPSSHCCVQEAPTITSCLEIRCFPNGNGEAIRRQVQ